MGNETPENLINRRRFLEKAGVAGAVLSSGSLLAQAAADRQGSRFAYDISRFSVTDPKLVGYTEERRFPAVAGRARRIWADGKGGFLVACASGAVQFASDGSKVGEYATPTGGRCVTKSESGAVYVGTREGIHVFDSNGSKRTTWAAPDRKTWITALEAAGGEVFAADSGNRSVLRYDEAGKVLGRIGAKDKERHVPGIILPSPYLDVRIAPDGLLRVNNTGRHCVEVYTREGDLELSWGKPGAAIQNFCGCCNPVALDILPDGRYLTCEKGLPRVKVYSPEGVFQTVVAGTEAFPENSRHGAARDAVDGTMGGLDAAVGPGGSIYILDLVTGDVRIMKAKA